MRSKNMTQLTLTFNPAALLLLSLLTFSVVIATPSGNNTPNAVYYEIMEKSPVGTVIGNLLIDAQLSTVYAPVALNQLRFSMLQDPTYNLAMDYISIDETTSVIKVKKVIDRDTLCPGSVTCNMDWEVGVSPANFFRVISVNLNILDLNDNSPTFPVNVISLTIMESVVPGSGFAIPAATDPDSPTNGILQYILTPDTKGLFQLKLNAPSNTPVLVVNYNLDQENVTHYLLTVTAVDGAIPPRSGSMLINITVGDVNDHAPVFSQMQYNCNVSENATAGTCIVTVQATDRDLGTNGRIYYQLSADTVSQPWSSFFEVDEFSGNVTLAQSGLDREGFPSYNLIVVASDAGVPSLSSTTVVNIIVIDINDNKPQVTINTLTDDGVAQVSEQADVGTFTALVFVTDPDVGQNGNVSCHLGTETDVFDLVELQYGRYKMVTKILLDYEYRSGFNVSIICQDSGQLQLSTTTILDVRVLDVNDNTPEFTYTIYNASVLENSPRGTYVIQVNATDPDSGDSGRVSYSILLGNGSSQLFYVDSVSGIVRTNATFDYETTPSLEIVVEGQDHGRPSRSSTSLVYVNVIDVNDVSPRFVKQSYAFSIHENLPPNQTVGYVSAIDPEPGSYGIVTYSIETMASGGAADTASDAFMVDGRSGRISTMLSLDREAVAIYRLVAVAGNEGFPQLTASVNVTISVRDVNDNGPIIDFPSSAGEGDNTVYISNALRLGQVVTQVKAHDNDASYNAQLFYSFTGASNSFSIDSKTGTVYVTSDLSTISAETFNLAIEVSDQGQPPLVTSANLTIVVNASIPLPLNPSNTNGLLLSTPNLTVVVCIASVSAVVVIILLIAIFCTVRRSRRTRKMVQIDGGGDGGGRIGYISTWNATIPSAVLTREEMKLERETVPSSSRSSSYATQPGGSLGGQGGGGYSRRTPAPIFHDRGKGNMIGFEGHDMWLEQDSNSWDSGRGPSEQDHEKDEHCTDSLSRGLPLLLPRSKERLFHPLHVLPLQTFPSKTAQFSLQERSSVIAAPNIRSLGVASNCQSQTQNRFPVVAKMASAGEGDCDFLFRDGRPIETVYGSLDLSDGSSITSGSYVIEQENPLSDADLQDYGRRSFVFV